MKYPSNYLIKQTRALFKDINCLVCHEPLYYDRNYLTYTFFCTGRKQNPRTHKYSITFEKSMFNDDISLIKDIIQFNKTMINRSKRGVYLYINGRLVGDITHDMDVLKFKSPDFLKKVLSLL